MPCGASTVKSCSGLSAGRRCSTSVETSASTAAAAEIRSHRRRSGRRRRIFRLSESSESSTSAGGTWSRFQQLSHSLICARPCGFPLRNPYSSHSSSAVIVPSKNRRAISLIRSFMARIFVARSKSYNNSKSLYPTCLIEKKRSSGISSARSRRLHLFLLRRPFAARPGSSQSSRPHDIKNKKREADARRNGRANDEARTESGRVRFGTRLSESPFGIKSSREKSAVRAFPPPKEAVKFSVGNRSGFAERKPDTASRRGCRPRPEKMKGRLRTPTEAGVNPAGSDGVRRPRRISGSRSSSTAESESYRGNSRGRASRKKSGAPSGYAFRRPATKYAAARRSPCSSSPENG